MPNDLFDFAQELDVAVGPSGLADKLHKELIDKRQGYLTKMTNGGCKTFDSYTHAVGFVNALDYVLGFAQREKNALEDSLRPAITEDDD